MKRSFVWSVALLAAFLLAVPATGIADEVNVGTGAVTVEDGKISVGGGAIEVTPEGIRVPGVTIKNAPRGSKGAGAPSGAMAGQSFHGADFSDSNLTGRNFSGSSFTAVDFSSSNLTDADFTGSDFQGVDFSEANLTGANFTDASLQGVDFSDANLQNSCFIRAGLTGNDFSDTNLTGALFTGARRVGNDFGGANMSAVVWEGPAVCPGGGPAASARPDLTSAAAITEALARGRDAKVDLTVNFKFDSDKIQSRGHAQMLEIANALKSARLTGQRFMIEGHTDNVGGGEYNLDLSFRRAVAVKRVLTEEYGIDSGLLEVNGFGADQPVASNDSEEGRALNRRVTLVNLGRI